MWAVLGGGRAGLAAAVLAPRIVKPTAYNNEISAQLLGLREYIEQDAAAGGKLTPEQGWALLPYAYVFGMTEEFCARFEADTAPCGTCAPGAGACMARPIWATPCRKLNAAIREAYAAQAQTSGGGSSGFRAAGFPPAALAAAARGNAPHAVMQKQKKGAGRVLLYLKKTLWVFFACLMAGFLAFSAFAMQDFLLVLALAAVLAAAFFLAARRLAACSRPQALKWPLRAGYALFLLRCACLGCWLCPAPIQTLPPFTAPFPMCWTTSRWTAHTPTISFTITTTLPCCCYSAGCMRCRGVWL